MNDESKIVETRDPDNNRAWIIQFKDGSRHPAFFTSFHAALWQFGMLRSRGFQEGVRA